MYVTRAPGLNVPEWVFCSLKIYRGPLILMQYALKYGKFLAFCIRDFIPSLTQTHLFNCTHLWYVPILNTLALYGHLT